METSEKKALNSSDSLWPRQAMQLLWLMILRLGWRYWIFFAVTMTMALSSLLPPKLFHLFTENLTKPDHLNNLIEKIIIFGLIISITMLISSVLATISQEWLRLTLQTDLRKLTLESVHAMPVDAEELNQGINRGEWLQRMTGDLSNVENFMTESLPEQIQDIAIIIGVAILFLIECGIIALIPIVSALILALINLKIQKKLAPVLSDLRDLNGEAFHLLIESFEAKKTIENSGGQSITKKNFGKKLDSIYTIGMKVVKTIGLLLAQNQLASNILTTTILSLVFWKFQSNSMTLSGALVVPFYIGLFFGASQGLARAAFDWNRFYCEGGRLATLIIDKKNLDEIDSPSSKIPTEISQIQKLKISNLSFGYGETIICADLSCSLEKNQITLITGPSGCGKSTLLEVIAGLRRPNFGSLLFYDREGNKLPGGFTKAPTYFPKKLTALVEQNPYLFDGTLRENLTFGDREAILTDEQITETLKSVSLSELLTRQRGGLDQRIFDRGQNLSIGQRYRVALARALLLERPFLLLDEPFAALDPKSAEEIANILSREKKSIGVILVSHQLPNFLNFDKHIDLSKSSSPILDDISHSFPTIGGPGFANFPPGSNHIERATSNVARYEAIEED
ncbi:MAG: ABC transporter ATP-binding protein [Bdellovibrionota bacterium]